jgi:short-subunit dehydrogenase
MQTFKDNVVILTGASYGIGEQIAYQLADQGAKLALAARSADKLENVAVECRKRGAEVITVPTDVTDEKACKKLIDQTVKAFGRVDTLLYNAGGGETRKFEGWPDLANARAEIELNYIGMLACVQNALPHLRHSKGRVVAVSSMGGVAGLPGTSTYNASKHAMRGFLNSLRVELLGSGVSVTLVHLAAVLTEGLKAHMGDKVKNIPATTPEQAAASIIKAGARRRREVIPSFEGKLLTLIYPLMPRMLDQQLAKVASLYEE